MEVYRQGDVLVRRIEKIPLRRRAVEEGEPVRIVLAHGEQTGHSHVVTARPEEARVRRSAEQTFLEVLSPAGVLLRHDEHADLMIPPGDYEIVRQREYNPEAPRRVAD